MMKLVGALMLAGAGTWLGFALSAGLERRVKALDSALFLLKQLCARVTHLNMPLPDAMRAVGDPLTDAAAHLHEGAQAAAQAGFAGSGMTQQDIAALASQIELMTSMSRKDCRGVCDGAISAIGLRLDQAKENANKNCKLLKALGICGGIAAAILMI